METLPCTSHGTAMAFWLIWSLEIAGALVLISIAHSRARAIYSYRDRYYTYASALRTFCAGLWNELAPTDRLLFGLATLIYLASLIILPSLALTGALYGHCLSTQ